MNKERLQVIYRHVASQKLAINLTNASSNKTQYYQGEFRYTLDNPMLSYDQRKFYEDNGYLVIPKLIEHKLLDEFSHRFADYCNNVISKGNVLMLKDVSLMKTEAKGEYLYNKLQDILYDEIFEKYFFNSRLLDYLSCFTGPEIVGVNSMLINKPPDAGTLSSRHPLHQDLHYFPFRPADRIVASWTAMEPVSMSNGCLFVISGSHKGVLLEHGYPKWEGGVNPVYHGILGYDNHETTPLIMDKGDTVFFHPLLIHGSGPNTTNGFRKAISGHFASSDCHFIDLNGTLQEDMAVEVEKIAAKKGLPYSIQTIWKLKSRPLRVQQGINNFTSYI